MRYGRITTSVAEIIGTILPDGSIVHNSIPGRGRSRRPRRRLRRHGWHPPEHRRRDRPRRRRRPRRHRAGAAAPLAELTRLLRRGVLAAAGLYLAVLAVHALTIVTSLETARSDLQGLSLSTIEARGGIRPALAPPLDAVDRARGWAHSPLLAPLRAVPVLGDQLDGVRSMTARLATIADAGHDALDRVDEAMADTGDEDGRLELLSTAVEVIDDVEARVLALPEPDDGALLGPLRRASRLLEDQLDEVPDRFAELRGHLEATRQVLAGPTRVLLLAANNAEMRAGVGMHLSAGVVTIEDGAFTTSRFFPTGAITERTKGRAEVPAELDDLFGGIWDFGHEWRTTSTTPDFTTAGRVFDQLAERAPIGPVDMVVSIDAPALASLLEATGPVEVDGRLVSSHDVVDLLLRDNYLQLGEVDERHERRDLQSRIASTIFETVTERDVDVVDLAAALIDAAEGRHLLGWSDDPGVQALWEALGADGALGARSFLVSAQNASASKRDYYLDPTVTVIPVGEPAEGRRRYRATLTLENPRVRPTAPYIDSLNRYVPQGVHRAYVSFTLPGAARDVVVRAGTPSRLGTDGPTVLATVWLRVAESQVGSAAVEFTLPDELRHVELVPGARVRPTTYRFGPDEVTDATPVTARLPLVADRHPQEARPVPAAALVLAFAGLVLVVTRSRRLAGPTPDRRGARVDGRLAVAAFVAAIALGALTTVG